MKIKTFKKIILSLVFSFAVSFAFAQMTAPTPPDPVGPGGDDPVGGGAPVGSGLVILLAAGAAYGGKKTYSLLKENKDA